MRKLFVICVLALALAVSANAFAAVQNIKVSGDITTRALFRSGYANSDDAVQYGDDQFLMTNARVRFDADLTDNVSAVLVLTNEKDWGVSREGNHEVTDAFDVTLEKAYVTLKEFFYSPLTLVVGRQNLWFGRGFIVGFNQAAWDAHSAISANEYSTTGTFDAVRAILDFNPWTLDLVYSTIQNRNDLPSGKFQTNLLGSNVNYQFSEYNAEAEAYIWHSRDDRGVAVPEETMTTIVGARGEFDPIANITIYAEGAYQWGKYVSSQDTAGATGTTDQIRKRSAWAVDAGIEYRFSDYAWQPKIGGEYIFYSGDENPWDDTDEYNGWNSFYRGKFDTAIREFLGSVYQTGDLYDPTSGTNQHQFAAEGSIRPIEPLEIYARYTYFRLHKKLNAAQTGGTARDEDLGHEVDIKVTYDYTEDVQFSLLNAWYFPGDYYDDAPAGENQLDDTIHQTVVTAKVSF